MSAFSWQFASFNWAVRVSAVRDRDWERFGVRREVSRKPSTRRAISTMFGFLTLLHRRNSSRALAAADDRAWQTFAKRYRAEMKRPPAARLLALLAALSRTSAFSVGCYCQDEARCHRSILKVLLEEYGARLE